LRKDKPRGALVIYVCENELQMQKPIFLLGFMGSGKTYWGKRLAAALEVEFIDLDQYIEKEESKSVPEIFAGQGEAGFRALERAHLRSLADARGVISTGGGTPCFFDNLDWMKSVGTTLHLKVPLAVLCERLGRQRAKRPLLAQLDDAELPVFVEKMLLQRAPFYERADAAIDLLEDEKKMLEHLLAACTT
jgi:shikimate kinase